MTQQPYPPQQGYPAQPPAYPPQPQPYAQPQYPQAPPPAYPPQAPPPAVPPQPLAQGSLDDFYTQPGGGTGPSIGWSDENGNQRPIGTTWIGVVARDVTAGDIEQQTDIKTQAPLTFRDGRPKFHMKVPMKQVALFDPQGNQLPTPKLTEGEGTWFCKGASRDELVRAMAEAGTQAKSPEGGAVIRLTLVQRRPNGGGMNPSNIVQISYTPPQGGQAGAPAQPPVAPPVQQAVQQPPPQQLPQPAPQQPAYGPPQGVPAYQPPQQQVAPAYQPPQAAAAPNGVQPPPNMDADQAALWARITQQGGQPAA